MPARLPPATRAGAARALGEGSRWLTIIIGLLILTLLVGVALQLMPAPTPPSVALPDVSPPQTGSAGSTAEPAASPTRSTPKRPETFRRRVLLHEHEWSLVWRIGALPLLAVAFGGLFGARRLRRRYDFPFARLSAVLATAAITVAAWSAAIAVPDSSGQPIRDGRVSTSVKNFDNGDREQVTTHERRHRHLPIQIALGWIAVGGAGFVLIGRDFASATRSRRRTQSGREPSAARAFQSPHVADHLTPKD